MVPIGSGPVAPSFKTPLDFTPDVSADEQASLQSQFATVQSTLTSNAKDFDAWIALGNLRKQAGDYVGAAADWKYALAIYPQNVVSNANLADLYTNYLHDYPKAAAAYKAQIAIDPTDVYIYQNLFQLYTSQFPQPSATIIAMLKQGIAANPKDISLMSTLAGYYKSTGDSADAKTEYAAAIASARAQSNQQAVTQLQQESLGL